MGKEDASTVTSILVTLSNCCGCKQKLDFSCGTREGRMGLYRKILEERAEEGYRRDVHSMLRFYVENGARSMGCGMRFASLKRLV